MAFLCTLYKVLKESSVMAFSFFYYSLRRRDKDVWVFGEWFGNRCCDNCFFLANYVAIHYPEKKLYWVAKESTDLSLLNSSIIRLPIDTKESISILKIAGVVIYNQDRRDITMMPYMYYGGALTVNLWHGVPWKHIGLDVVKASRSVSSRSLLYIKMQYYLWEAKMYLSLSEKFSHILKSAYLCSDTNIIRSGYPRNMLFYNENSVQIYKKKVKSYLWEKYGFLLNDTTRIITYMPTFRDNVEEVFSFITKKNEDIHLKLEQWDAVILEKSHFVTTWRNKNSNGGGGRVYSIDSCFMSQELLAASDMLITDYSSCFFDYLLIDKPILHYLYDFEYYSSADRGLYYSKDDVVCGDVAYDFDQLVLMIESNLSNPQKNHALRERRKEQFMEYESHTSCQKIYELINERV